MRGVMFHSSQYSALKPLKRMLSYCPRYSRLMQRSNVCLFKPLIIELTTRFGFIENYCSFYRVI